MPEDNNDQHAQLMDLPMNKMVNNRFRVLRKLGDGGCGAVFAVMDETTRTEVALKVETTCVDDEGGNVLKVEADVLHRLKKINATFVTELLWAGKRQRYSYMVTTLLGHDLRTLWRGSGVPHLSESTVIRLGLHALHGLKQLHDVGFVHRDLKPANVAIGREGPAARFLHLLDFGLSRAFVLFGRRRRLRPPRTDVLFRGTMRYCSPNLHDGLEQGRHDDLLSLVYMLVDLRCGLPWHSETSREKVAVMKEKTPDKTLLASCPPELLTVMRHLRRLDYATPPNYSLVYEQLIGVMKRQKYAFSARFEWESAQVANIPEPPVDPRLFSRNIFRF